MPKVLMLTTAADADGVHHAGSVVNVSKQEADDYIAGGYARSVSASEEATAGPSENASRRRGKQQTISGDEDA